MGMGVRIMSRWKALAVAATIAPAEYEPRLVDCLEAFAELAVILDDHLPCFALVPHPDALVEAAQALVDTLEERTAEKESFEEESQGFENERDDAQEKLEEAQKQIDSLEKQCKRAEEQAGALREELTRTQFELRHARDEASDASETDAELRALRAFRETVLLALDAPVPPPLLRPAVPAKRGRPQKR